MSDRRSVAATKAWATRRSASYKARKTEAASKVALTVWCRANGLKVLFFEGSTGAPRTGIVDALIARVSPSGADVVELKLVQLKAGSGGVTASEITRLKTARDKALCDWLVAAFDGETLHMLPAIPTANARRKV